MFVVDKVTVESSCSIVGHELINHMPYACIKANIASEDVGKKLQDGEKKAGEML